MLIDERARQVHFGEFGGRFVPELLVVLLPESTMLVKPAPIVPLMSTISPADAEIGNSRDATAIKVASLSFMVPSF